MRVVYSASCVWHAGFAGQIALVQMGLSRDNYEVRPHTVPWYIGHIFCQNESTIRFRGAYTAVGTHMTIPSCSNLIPCYAMSPAKYLCTDGGPSMCRIMKHGSQESQQF